MPIHNPAMNRAREAARVATEVADRAARAPAVAEGTEQINAMLRGALNRPNHLKIDTADYDPERSSGDVPTGGSRGGLDQGYRGQGVPAMPKEPATARTVDDNIRRAMGIQPRYDD